MIGTMAPADSTFRIRLTPELRERILELARRRGVTPGQIAAVALSMGLDRLEQEQRGQGARP